MHARPPLSVIVPAYNAQAVLNVSIPLILEAIADTDELLCIDDGSVPPVRVTGSDPRLRVHALEKNTGSACARNAGARLARNPILLFVDADVLVGRDAIERLVAEMLRTGSHAAFGSYDVWPTERGIVSECRNLLHHYIHQNSGTECTTFWAGFGAINAATFWDIGGFDSAWTGSSIEDIELGTRLHFAGRRIYLAPEAQVSHAKRWTLVSMLQTDLCNRAIPWTLLCLETRLLPKSLNMSSRHRVSIASCAAMCVVATLTFPYTAHGSFACALTMLLGAVYISSILPFVTFLLRVRDSAFAILSIPVLFLHHTCAWTGAFIAGTVFLLRNCRARASSRERSTIYG